MTKTILELDLVGYSTIADILEQGLNVEISPQLIKQIQGFIDMGLTAVGLSRESTVMQTTGDGAILVFDNPSQAHNFADAIHETTRIYNQKKAPGIGKRVFRIGIATGDLVMEAKPTGGYDIAGMTIARAVRFEAKAKPGEVMCDPDSFRGLSTEQKKGYAVVETVQGKRDEFFEAHRCVLNPDGVKDAELFMGSTNSRAKTNSINASTPPKFTGVIMKDGDETSKKWLDAIGEFIASDKLNDAIKAIKTRAKSAGREEAADRVDVFSGQLSRNNTADNERRITREAADIERSRISSAILNSSQH